MADIADLAQEAEERHREAALAASRLPQRRAGAECCRRCGDEIPAERLRAVPDAVTCVDCQRDLERGKL